MIAPPSGLEDDFDAAVLLVIEHLVEVGAFFEARRVGDDEGRVDVAVLDMRQQLRQVALDRRLRHAHGQSAVDGRSERDLVEESAIDADDRDRAEIARAVDCLTQDMRPVGAHEGRDLYPVDHRVEAGIGERLGTDGIDAGVCAAALGQFLDAVVDILVEEIDGDGAGGARQFQPLRNRVDRDDPLGAEQERAADRHLPDRAAAPDGDRVALLDVAEIRRHVAGRENVGEEQHLLVAQARRHLDRPDIGVGHAQILRLAAGKAAEKVRIAEQAGRRMTPQRLGLFLAFLRIGPLAAGEGAALAEEAFAAGDDEGHDHPVADLQVGDA